MSRYRNIYFINHNKESYALHVRISELNNNIFEKYNIEITLQDIFILKYKKCFNQFINYLTKSFIDFTKDNKKRPIYIPSQCEVLSFDDGFIDAYYDIRFAKEKDEALYLTQGFDVNKPILTYSFDLSNSMILKFNSLFSTNEFNEKSCIWNISKNEVSNLLQEAILKHLEILNKKKDCF